MNKIVFAIYTSAIYSKSITDSSDFESKTQFRNVQLDASSFIFDTKISALCSDSSYAGIGIYITYSE